MKFGFIGAGTVTQTIARHVLPFGHEVLLSNSRGPETLADIVRQQARVHQPERRSKLPTSNSSC